MAAISITDDFSSAARWDAAGVFPLPTLFSVADGRLNYAHPSSASGDAGWLLKDVTLTLDRDWSMQVDAHIGAFPLSIDGQYADVFLVIGKVGSVDNDHIEFGVERGQWGGGGGYSTDEGLRVGGVSAARLFSYGDITSSDVSLRWEYSAITHVLTFKLDRDGPAGAGGWLTLGAADITSGSYNFHAGPTDPLAVALVASSQFQVLTAGMVWMDNFQLTIADPPTDISRYMVEKGRAYDQTGATTLTIPATGGWHGGCDVDGSSADAIVSASVTFPAPDSSAHALTASSGSTRWRLADSRIDSQAQLDAQFPAGNYVFNVVTAHDGVVAKTVTFPASPAYPEPVTILNHAALQAIDASAPLTVSWTPWTAGTDNDAFSVWIEDEAIGELLFKNNPIAPEAGGTATSIAIPAATLVAGRTYSLTVQPIKFYEPATRVMTPGAAVVISATLTRMQIRTAASAPTIITQPASRIVSLGDFATLSVQAAGSGALQYQWRKNGADIAGATLDSLTLSNVQLADLGYYSVVVAGGGSQTTSAAATVTLAPVEVAADGAGDVTASASFDGTNYLVGIRGGVSGNDSVTAQRLSGDGALVGSRIATARAGGVPFTAFDGTNHLLVWDDNAVSGALRLYGAFVRPDGTLVAAPFAFPVAVGSTTTQRPQGIAFNGTSYLVAYNDGNSNPRRICARFVSTAGVVGDEIVLATNAINSLQAIASAGGSFLVAWPARLDTGGNSVQGRIISSSGVVSSVFTISEANSPAYNPLCVASDGANFLVAWNHDTGPGYPAPTQWELRGRIVTPAGGFAGPQFTIADTATNPVMPAVGFDGTRYLVTWAGVINGADLDLLGRYVSAAGTPSGGILALGIGAGHQGIASVVRGTTSLLVAYTDGLVWADPPSGVRVRGVLVPVSSSLAITSQPSSAAVAAGAVASFTVVATGSPSPSYRWQRSPAGSSTWANLANGGAYSGVMTATLSVTGTVVAMSGDQFRCVASNGVGGDAPSNPATLTVTKSTASVVLSALTQGYTGAPRPVTVATTPAGLASTITYAGSAVVPTNVGSYVVVVTITDANYAGSASGTLAILPAVGSGSGGSGPASAGSTVTLSASADGGSFQWQRLETTNPGALDAWADIPGATQSSFSIASPQHFDAGSYRVVVTKNGVPVPSEPFLLVVSPAPASDARLMNLSTRALCQTGDNILIPGFVVDGAGAKRMLIRGIGPTLAGFGVGGTLADPQMTLTRNGTVHASNDDWGTNVNVAEIITTSATVGAFGLTGGSADAALLLDLPAGQYTVMTSGKNAGTGVAMVELYDADPGTPAARLVNISNRGFVGTGDSIMIPGFVVSNEGARTFLVRAVGPTLAGFGVGGTLADPQLAVFKRRPGTATDDLILVNDNWDGIAGSATTLSVATEVGAFPLGAGSKDAAFVVTLPPGIYTVQASGVGATTGVALVEVYLVP